MVIDKDITQANIILGNLGIARNNPDFYAFQVMNYLLGGGGFASRLMDDIRVNRGLAYSVYSAFEPGLEPGPFIVALETKNATAGEAITQVVAQLRRIMTQPVTPEELKDANPISSAAFPGKWIPSPSEPGSWDMWKSTAWALITPGAIRNSFST